MIVKRSGLSSHVLNTAEKTILVNQLACSQNLLIELTKGLTQSTENHGNNTMLNHTFFFAIATVLTIYNNDHSCKRKKSNEIKLFHVAPLGLKAS